VLSLPSVSGFLQRAERRGRRRVSKHRKRGTYYSGRPPKKAHKIDFFRELQKRFENCETREDRAMWEIARFYKRA
jgi:hypothetical protein